MEISRKRLTDVIGSLEYDELVELQRQLFVGGREIRQLVSNKLKEIAASEARTCGTCGAMVNLRVANEFTLIFGPPEMKKRLSFCAPDCMEYFAANLKRMAQQVKNAETQG